MKNLKIIDNFLNPSDLTSLYTMVINSRYTIGWSDDNELRHKLYPNLHSMYNFEDIQKTKLLNPVLKLAKTKNIDINDYYRSVVNLTKPLDVNFIHSHPDSYVFLFYCNLTWNHEWGGETVFYSNDKKDIIYSSPYTSNRLIFFDGDIPHTIKSQNLIGPTYRFTLSIFFNKLKK